MKILISPAKRLDYKSELPVPKYSRPHFIGEATRINAKLESKSRKELAELMKISQNLADLNYQRYKEFQTPFTSENARPAVYAYSGDVYNGLDAYTIPKEKLDLLQDSVRILSGMYGLLKPFDLIQPYRLEMHTKIQPDGKKDLYEFWTASLTRYLKSELDEGEIVLNLASLEYSKSIDFTQLDNPVISPVFKDFNKGELKIISFYAKKARGSMARFVIDHNIQSSEDILGFDYDGYAFSQEHTEREEEPVFIR